MSERRVKSEKATLMALAFLAISSGITLISQDNLVTGAILVIIGMALIVLREHFKFKRWHKMVGSNSYWRGKPQ